MDANSFDGTASNPGNNWFLQLSEQSLRGFTMFLVLTGQMLPSGAIHAQEEPLAPSCSSPVTADAPQPDVTQPDATEPDATEPDATGPTPPAPADTTPLETSPEASESAEPPAAVTEPPSESVPAPSAPAAPGQDDAISPELAEDQQATEKEPLAKDPQAAKDQLPVNNDKSSEVAAPEPTPPASAPSIDNSPPLPTIDPSGVESMPQEGQTYVFGDWTVVVRPGPVAPQPLPAIQAPLGDFVNPQTNVHVPVDVRVNQIAPQSSAWSGWGAPWAYPAYWTAPTSAYLFQRPQPYWQLRQDFFHLRPFIPGLW